MLPYRLQGSAHRMVCHRCLLFPLRWLRTLCMLLLLLLSLMLRYRPYRRLPPCLVCRPFLLCARRLHHLLCRLFLVLWRTRFHRCLQFVPLRLRIQPFHRSLLLPRSHLPHSLLPLCRLLPLAQLLPQSRPRTPSPPFPFLTLLQQLPLSKLLQRRQLCTLPLMTFLLSSPRIHSPLTASNRMSRVLRTNRAARNRITRLTSFTRPNRTKHQLYYQFFPVLTIWSHPTNYHLLIQSPSFSPLTALMMS